MARKDDIETPAPPGDAAAILKGLAGELAEAVRVRAAAFLSEATSHQTVDREMRSLALIARAAIAAHALQAAEEKVEERAFEARAKRRDAVFRAGRPGPETDSKTDEETDMNERDPRLDTPEGVAEVYEGARKGVDRLLRELEVKHADRNAVDGAGGVGAGFKLAAELAPAPAPAH